MDRQIIQRAQGVVNHHRAGQVAGLYRAGRFIYNNRQNIADMARYGYRMAQRAYNRFGGRSVTANTRSSQSTMLKPARYGGGSGGYRPRKFVSKFRRRGRKFRGKGRRYRKRSSIRSLIKDLWVIRKHKKTNYWYASASIGSQLRTSMEIGNYDPGTFPADTGCQSPFAQKVSDTSYTNHGSINEIVTESGWNSTQKRFLYPHKLKMTITNASNSSVRVRFYVCQWRKAEGTAGELRLVDKYNSAVTADTGGTTLANDFSPFDLPSFTSQIKILSSWSKTLGSGEQTIARCQSAHYGSMMFRSVTDEPITRFTRGILILAEGITVHDQTSKLAVARGPCSLNISATGSLKYKLMQGQAATISTGVIPSGSVSTAEVPVGNAGAPMAYDD